MPSILSRLGKASKVKVFVLEMDNYYDVQRPERDNKVSKAVTVWIVHTLEWWTSKNAYFPEVVSNLTWVGFMELFGNMFTPESKNCVRE